MPTDSVPSDRVLGSKAQQTLQIKYNTVENRVNRIPKNKVLKWKVYISIKMATTRLPIFEGFYNFALWIEPNAVSNYHYILIIFKPYVCRKPHFMDLYQKRPFSHL